MANAGTINFKVNGQDTSVATAPDRPLLEVLREDLELTGPKYGCGEGSCGACTVLVNGKRTFSCSTAVSEAAGKSIITIEGLAPGADRLHPVQQAFIDGAASQCGYCTGGMILATVALLERTPSPTDAQIVEWMNPHLCRCCNYTRIQECIKNAATATAAKA